MCQACPKGTYNEGGDLASEPDTVCDSLICDTNYYVSDHTCQPCVEGKYNYFGDDASGPDTTCDTIICAENEYVSNHTCQACPAGTYNSAGDWQVKMTLFAIASFVTTTTMFQIINVYNASLVHTMRLVMMPVDLIRYARLSFAPKMNMFLIMPVKRVQQVRTILLGILLVVQTRFVTVFCSENYRVEGHECIECAPGTYNSGGDDAVDLILYVMLYNALKMNMFLTILVKRVQQALIMRVGI